MKRWACVPFHLLKKKRKRQVAGGGKEEEREKWHRPTSIYYAPVTQPLWTRGITMALWDPHWHPSQSHPLLGQGCRNMQSFCVPFPQSSSFIVCLFSPSCTQPFSHLETDCAAAKRLKCQEPSTASCPDWEKSVKGRERELTRPHSWLGKGASNQSDSCCGWPASPRHPSATDHLPWILQASTKHHIFLQLCYPFSPPSSYTFHAWLQTGNAASQTRTEVTTASHLPGHPYTSVRAVQGSFSS